MTACCWTISTFNSHSPLLLSIWRMQCVWLPRSVELCQWWQLMFYIQWCMCHCASPAVYSLLMKALWNKLLDFHVALSRPKNFWSVCVCVSYCIKRHKGSVLAWRHDNMHLPLALAWFPPYFPRTKRGSCNTLPAWRTGISMCHTTKAWVDQQRSSSV